MTGPADGLEDGTAGPSPGPRAGPTGAEDVACGTASREADEPVEATAPHAVAWVGVVVPGAWPRDDRSRVPEQLRAGLAASPGVRVVLVRPAGGVRSTTGLLLAGTVPGRSWLREVPTEQTPAALQALADPRGEAVTRLGTARDPGLGRPTDRPAVLVCVDGACDPCCARYGPPAATGLRSRLSTTRTTLLRRRTTSRADVWESSHLDGGRFAPTAALLPSGMVLGGLGPDPAGLVEGVEALLDGRPVLDGYRGRSTYPAAEQAAETAVRRHLAMLGINAGPDDVRVDGSEALDPAEPLRRVFVRHSGGRTFRVLVERVETDLLRPVTCGAPPGPVVVFSTEVDSDNVPGIYVGV
ncbi:sucrase ferredoxin [Aquipuribacter sp. MA13-6]|uniref:sucrase ferredoxin n=1 Tax=unclassified Aquipuribacter TaxID=2635084 RepID=UPI003EEE6792